MADKFLSITGLRYYYNRIKTLFATKTELNTLDDKVDEIIAEGGEPNVIEVVQKNGTALPINNKTVNVEVPTTTSELTNNGDGTSNFATESYVSQYGGKIDVIQVNSVPQTITNKTVNIDLSGYAESADLPTKTSDLTNDSNYQTQAQVQALIDSELADITGIDFQVVQTLPSSGVKGTIYLVPKTGTSGDIYDEYIWLTPAGETAHWEQIGSTAVDLSNYWSQTDLVAITTAEIDEIIGE